MSRRRPATRVATAMVVLFGIAALGVIAFVVVRGDGGSLTGPAGGESGFDYDYDIPAGTAARIAAGETIEIVPRELDVHVGETIRIVNDDASAHNVGLFYVGAGETLVQTFTRAGTLSGTCTVHPSGQFTLRVLP